MVELKKKVTLKTKVGETIPNPPKKSKKWWIVGLFFLILVIGLIFLLKSKDENIPSDVIEPTDAVSSCDTTSCLKDLSTSFVLEEEMVSDENVVKIEPQRSQTTMTSDSDSRESSNQEPLVDTLEQKAKRVIRGDFGNGNERKDKLGSEYEVIQNKVNEMYRNGLVY